MNAEDKALWSPEYGYKGLRQLSDGRWACTHRRLYNTILIAGIDGYGRSEGSALTMAKEPVQGSGGYAQQY